MRHVFPTDWSPKSMSLYFGRSLIVKDETLIKKLIIKIEYHYQNNLNKILIEV